VVLSELYRRHGAAGTLQPEPSTKDYGYAVEEPAAEPAAAEAVAEPVVEAAPIAQP
jgi:hypothetical protein